MCCSSYFMHPIFINTETPDERQARMSADRLRHCAQHEINLKLPIFISMLYTPSSLNSIQHWHLCSFTLVLYTCAEHYPNLNVVPASDGTTECRRCNQDKHIPKVYSSANDMNPGPLPQQLQVSNSFVYYWNLKN